MIVIKTMVTIKTANRWAILVWFLASTPCLAETAPTGDGALSILAEAPFYGVEIRVTNREVYGPERLGQALVRIHELGWLPTREREADAGDTTCRLVMAETNWPGPTRDACPESLLALTQSLNPKTDLTRIQIGQTLRVPAINVEEQRISISVRSGPSAAATLNRLGIPMGAVPQQSVDHSHIENVDLIRYLVPISLDEEQARTLSRDPVLVRLPDVNVRLVGYSTGEPGSMHANGVPQLAPLSQGHRNPRDFAAHVNANQGKCPVGWEGDILHLLSATSAAGTELCEANCRDWQCPTVEIVDPSDSTEHPDFVAYPISPWDDCSFHVYEQKQDHANGLRGIISAQRNGRGLTGVFPTAVINAIRLDENASEPTSDVIQFAKRPQRRVYVVATDWKDDSGSPGGMTQAVSHDQESSLWVVAAGQSKTSQEGAEIEKNSLDLRPMSLGRDPNVLVVTACDHCDLSGPDLLNSVNKSESFVHVAAPGRDVPTTSLDSRYQLMTGTSPAAAYVGGLAAALWSCYGGGMLPHADDVKARIQVTSRPARLPDRQQSWLASGIVDPRVAMLDPAKVWLRRRGEDQHKPVVIRHWCVGVLTLGHPKTGNVGEGDFLGPQFVRRIVRVDDGDDKQGWFFFRTESGGSNKNDFAEDRLKVFGPAALTPVLGTGKKGVDKPLLQLDDENKTIITLAELGDIIGNPSIADRVQECIP